MTFAPSPLTANLNTHVEVDPKSSVDVKHSFNIFCCRRKRRSSIQEIDKRVSNVAKKISVENHEQDH